MARRRNDAGTGDLFAAIPQPVQAAPGALDFRTELSCLLSQMLAETQADDPEHDRYWVAANVSRYVGKEISKAMLDGYTAESRDAFNLPFWLVVAIEHVCRSTLLTDWHAAKRGGRFLMGPAALDAEIGRLQSEMASMGDRLRAARDLRRRMR